MTGRINWSPPSSFAALGTLPVRLRTPDGEVVATGVSDRDIAAPPGRYFLCVTLPNGREVIGRTPVEMTADGAPDLPTLEVEMARNIDVRRFLTGEAHAGAEAAGPARRATLGRWQGDWVARWDTDPPAVAASDGIELDDRPRPVTHGDEPDDILFLATGAGRRAFVLPFDRPLAGGASERAMLVRLAPDGGGIRLSSPVSSEANAYAEFVDQGLLAESKRLSLDLIDNGQAAPGDRSTSLLRAILGLYVLLRANEFTPVDAYVDRMLEIASDVPDIHAIRAEVRARQGRHEEAIAALRLGLSCGCPWFRSGVSYVLERLRLYVAVDSDSSSFSLAPEDGDRFRRCKARLERMALRLDMGELFTSLTLGPSLSRPAPSA